MNANIKFLYVLELGFLFDTTLKSFFIKTLLSGSCIKIELKFDIMFSRLFNLILLESIILRFFFFDKIFKALFSIPLQITTSKKNLIDFYC